MNYKKIYDALVDKAKPRGLDKSQHEGYFEIHHIVPRSMGGTNADENLVMFTAREHFIAHMLLWKAYPNESSLFYAAMMMSNRFTDRKSRLYESMKQILAAKMSERRKGKYKDLTGQKFGKLRVIELARLQLISEDDESKGRRAIWACLCDCGNEHEVIGGSLTSGNTKSCGCLPVELGKARSGENSPMWGRKHTEETKEKFKLRRVLRGPENPMWGRAWTDEQREAASSRLKGTKWTEARRAAAVFPVGEDHSFFGKNHTEETRKKISQILKDKNQRPWENLSTQTDESLTKWAMCDYYYDLWILSGKVGLKRFTKFYNETHNDSVSLAFFTNPRIKFVEGWIPQEDEEWVEFSKNYLEGGWLKQ